MQHPIAFLLKPPTSTPLDQFGWSVTTSQLAAGSWQIGPRSSQLAAPRIRIPALPPHHPDPPALAFPYAHTHAHTCIDIQHKNPLPARLAKRRLCSLRSKGPRLFATRSCLGRRRRQSTCSSRYGVYILRMCHFLIISRLPSSVFLRTPSNNSTRKSPFRPSPSPSTTSRPNRTPRTTSAACPISST